MDMKVVEAFASGGATGLAMLAMLLVIVFLIRTIVVLNRQTIAAFEKVAEASKVDADANKALSVAIGRIEAKMDFWPIEHRERLAAPRTSIEDARNVG